MNETPHQLSLRKIAAPVAVLLIAFALMVTSAARKSATVDEQSHLLRGAAYLQTGATHFLLGHPLLGSIISALPLLTEPDLRLPVATAAWDAGDWSLAGDAFLWQINDAPLRLLFLARLPVIWLTLLLGALVFRWGRSWAGWRTGLLALALLVLDPNVLAHGRFVTGDVPLALFFALALYGYWRWAVWPVNGNRWSVNRNRWSVASKPWSGVQQRNLGKWSWLVGLIISGVGFGLAGATKFNAALLVPIFGIWGGVLAWRRRSWQPLLALLPVGLLGWVVIWAVYGFELWQGYLPGGAFWDDLFWQLQYVGGRHGAYLFGASSTSGWWYYFPITFVLKTPLLTLLLYVGAIGYGLWRGTGQLRLFLLLPPLLYLLGSMTLALNIGYRYLIPMLPFLALAAAVSLQPLLRRRWWLLVAAWPVLLALLIWPDYVPFFNSLTAGNGWRMLSDSNVDWGQDLPALAAWQAERDEPVNLSYFGTAHPSAYGVLFTSLPTWAPGPEQGNPAFQLYNPANPAPGFYAISVTNLHGVVLGQERDLYRGFREQLPLARLGGTVFVYEVLATGPPVDVAYSGLRPADLESSLAAAWQSNDVRVRWFDARNSLIWPGSGGWLAVDGTVTEHPQLAALWPQTAVSTTATQSLYRQPRPPRLPWTAEQVPFGPVVYVGQSALTVNGGEIALLTAWEVRLETADPLKIFVHALDAGGEIVAQWDGLDVPTHGWHAGDMFVQAHRLPPQTGVAEDLIIGIYDSVTGVRTGEPVHIPLPPVAPNP